MAKVGQTKRTRVLDLENVIFDVLCAQYETYPAYEKAMDNLKTVFMKGIDDDRVAELRIRKKQDSPDSENDSGVRTQDPGTGKET